jgi:maltose O-acetyltransferase
MRIKLLTTKLREKFILRNQTAILRSRGMRIGRNVRIHGGVVLDAAHAWHISIGDDVTIAPRALVLAHDASTKKLVGKVRIALTVVGDRVFVGAGAIVMPGVFVGNDAIIGAGSVVTKDVEQGTIVAGNPARVIGSTSDRTNRAKEELERYPVFDKSYTVKGGVTGAQKKSMNEAMVDRQAYID